MGVREWLSMHPRLTIGLASVLVLGSTAYLVTQVLAGRPTLSSKLPDSYYSVDDGKTFFVANSENVAPFDFQGKTAVHAYVFRCSDGKRFVGFLERYTPEARRTIVEKKYSTREIEMYGREVKRPGDSAWIKASDEIAVAKITDVKCPDGHGSPEPIEP